MHHLPVEEHDVPLPGRSPGVRPGIAVKLAEVINPTIPLRISFCTVLRFVAAKDTLNPSIRDQPHQRYEHIDAACDQGLKKSRQDSGAIEDR